MGWAILVLAETEQHAHAEEDGNFRILHVPQGRHTVQVMRVGYGVGEWVLDVDDDVTDLTLRLVPQALRQSTTVVTSEQTDRRSTLEKPEQSMSGRQLRQNLSGTIAGTVALEPGLSQRSMGPAPARPVLRGLGGDRLLVLEDGGRTGDLSATSSDHAVAIEPLTTERIEILRGPQALLYGSNTLGGVVNVVRGAVPRDRVEGVNGSLTWQAESINRGGGAGVDLYAPAGPLSLRLDASLRTADDMGTPEGTLRNTDLSTGNAAVGAAWVHPAGYIGVAASIYDSDYGIPPDPLGGHPSGVDIHMDRRHRELRVAPRLNSAPP